MLKNVQKGIQKQKKDEKDLSLKLIKILIIHLKLSENKELAQLYSKQYAFIKFLLKNVNLQQSDVKFEDVEYQPLLNETNFMNLIMSGDLE